MILLHKIVAVHHHCLVKTRVTADKDVHIVRVISVKHIVVREVTTVGHTKHLHVFKGEERHSELIHSLHIPVTIPGVCAKAGMDFDNLLRVATEPIGRAEGVAIVLLTGTSWLHKGEIVAVGAIGLEEILTGTQSFLPKLRFVTAGPHLIDVLVLLIAGELKIRFLIVEQRRSHEVPQFHTQAVG